MSDLPVMIIFLVLVALLLQIDFIFYIAYVCLGVYLFSRWYTPRALRGVAIGRSYADHAFLGERIPVTLTVQNTGRLPLPWVELAESLPVMLQSGHGARQRAITLRGRETTIYTYHVQTHRRGYYRLGPLQLSAGDLFGFSEQLANLPADYLTVYPRIIPLARLGLPSRLPFGTLASRQRLFADPARPMGVRDYHSGDSLRQINWKVSAHTDDLLVKTFEPAISLETTILLNLNRDEYSRTERYAAPEWAVVVAASLAAHLADQRQAVGLITNGADPLRPQTGAAETGVAFDEQSGRLLLAAGSPSSDRRATIPTPVPPRPGRAHLMKVLEILARIEAAPTVPLATWTPSACLHLSWGTTILAITPVGDEAMCQALHRLLRAGYNPILIVVEPTAFFGQVRERARRLGFPAYLVVEERDFRF